MIKEVIANEQLVELIKKTFTEQKETNLDYLNEQRAEMFAELLKVESVAAFSQKIAALDFSNAFKLVDAKMEIVSELEEIGIKIERENRKIHSIGEEGLYDIVTAVIEGILSKQTPALQFSFLQILIDYPYYAMNDLIIDSDYIFQVTKKNSMEPFMWVEIVKRRNMEEMLDELNIKKAEQ